MDLSSNCIVPRLDKFTSRHPGVQMLEMPPQPQDLIVFAGLQFYSMLILPCSSLVFSIPPFICWCHVTGFLMGLQRLTANLCPKSQETLKFALFNNAGSVKALKHFVTVITKLE